VREQIEEQAIRMMMEYRPRPWSLLLDERAAEVLIATTLAWWRADYGCAMLLTGDTFPASLTSLHVVRVPDTGGAAVVVDAWGKPA
jgi:hypothetical protein